MAGGSVLHLRSVLKASAVWAALVEAWTAGAVLAGSSAGAMVLGNTMVDPRGGALTLGLGLLSQLAVLPHANDWSEEKTHRTVRLATGGLRIAAIDERTALLRAPDGRWRQAGAGGVTIWLDGRQVGLDALGRGELPRRRRYPGPGAKALVLPVWVVPIFVASAAISLLASDQLVKALERLGTDFGAAQAFLGLIVALAADGPSSRARSLR